jgi:predicted RNase H-like HicB family nuclease
MRYPIAIELGDEATAFGVVVPDLPGCFSAGDSLDEAVSGAEEAAAAWIDAALDAGEAIPAPSSLEGLRQNPAYAGWMFGVITLDPALFDDTIERVNISLPRRVLKRLDALASSAGESRSGFIAQLTLEERRRAG